MDQECFQPAPSRSESKGPYGPGKCPTAPEAKRGCRAQAASASFPSGRAVRDSIALQARWSPARIANDPMKRGSTEREVTFESFNEALYLERNPDVARAVAAGQFAGGWEHYERYGKAEGRLV